MLQATTKLEVQKDTGKILSHIETWHNKSVRPLSFGRIALTNCNDERHSDETADGLVVSCQWLTLVSCGMQTFIPGFVKPFIGTSSCTLFKIMGWGKDVDAREAATTSVQ